jgi:hypothetical protein
LPYVYDRIRGEHDPHLFFEWELFDSLMRMTYAEDDRSREVWREIHEEHRRAVGLPDDFWERLDTITAAYRKDRVEERRLGLSRTRSAIHAAETEAVSKALCRDRALALAALRREFPRFSEFLYTAIGSSGSMTILYKSEESVRRMARGECK